MAWPLSCSKSGITDGIKRISALASTGLICGDKLRIMMLHSLFAWKRSRKSPGLSLSSTGMEMQCIVHGWRDGIIVHCEHGKLCIVFG